MPKAVELLPVTYDPDRLLMWADENFRRIVDAVASLKANDIGAGTFPGPSVFGDLTVNGKFQAKGIYPNHNYFWDGIELAQPSSTPYIDFHRSSDPAEATDYNVRLINDASGVLHMLGGILKVDSNIQSNAWKSIPDDTDDAKLDLYGGVYVIGVRSSELYFKSGGNSIGFEAPPGAWALRFDNPDWVTNYSFTFQRTYHNSHTNMRFNTIYLRGDNDGAHRLVYQASPDGPRLNGYSGMQFALDAGACTLTWDNSGQLYTNYGCGLDGAWCLNSRVFGNATGGTLRTKQNGNYFRMGWSPADITIDTTVVKTFVIDHPVEEDRYLVHACIEAPEITVFYRGQSQLEDGWVCIDLPDYFEALCAEEGRSVQLTCIADDPADEWCPVLHATYPKKGKFYVGLGSGMSIRDQKFWWHVTAVRKDVEPLNVTPLKAEVEVLGDGPYTYYRKKAS